MFVNRSSDAGPMDDRSPCKGKVAISGMLIVNSEALHDSFILHNGIYLCAQVCFTLSGCVFVFIINIIL